MSNYNKSLKKTNNDSKKNVLGNKKEHELNNKSVNDINNNIFNDIKNNKFGNRIVSNNIPVNMNKVEYIHYSNEKKNKINNVENNSEIKIFL